ncbi:MAG: DUF362 domain-containing protein [Bacteroidales bacterium]|nr:DUF362 domain-containing protein [Bacteroidales bacterium]MBN2821425.1 DUF362 domain-containing protein [Bacteroidales bacterium]
MTTKKISRRKLIKDTTAATFGAALFLNSPIRLFGHSSENLTKVVLIRNKSILNSEGEANKEVLQTMLNEAIVKLTNANNAQEAWKKILTKDDILGIKTNVWNKLRTPVELEQVIKENALQVGISEDNIGIDDRGIRDNPVFKKSTALINVRPMRTHAWSGVGSLLKNYIMFVDRPSAYHSDSCADLAAIWKLDNRIEKTRLNILVMLTPLFHGVGPHHFNKQFTWKYNGLIVGFDPVAVDSVGLKIIEAKRTVHFGEETPLNPPAKHIPLADARHKLGTADPAKINLLRLGDNEDILI